MVWAIVIACVSLSCEPVPVVVGLFYDEPDCVAALRVIGAAWQPAVGIYELKCFPRSVI